jgi:hypothetical protein
MQTTECYAKAVQLLHEGLTPRGYLASISGEANYHRIWARDAVFTGLAATTTGDKKLVQGLKTSLQTLLAGRHELGFIPSNVQTDKQGNLTEVSFGGLTGRVDANLWFLIGALYYLKLYKDDDFRKQMQEPLKQIFHILRLWEFNGRGLLYVPQGGDWADEFFLEGYVFYDQLLYYRANRLAAEVLNEPVYERKATELLKLITINFWPDAAFKQQAYHPIAYEELLNENPPEHWMAGFKPSGYFSLFDCLAHGLTFLLNINSRFQKEKVIVFIEQLTHFQKKKLLPSFWPPVEVADSDWDSLQKIRTYGFRNRPGEYQNGAIWPFSNGLLIAGLYKNGYKHLAGQMLEALREVVRLPEGQYGFYEYIDSINWHPGGVKHQLWSAAGLILAEKAAQNIFIF